MKPWSITLLCIVNTGEKDAFREHLSARAVNVDDKYRSGAIIVRAETLVRAVQPTFLVENKRAY